MSTPVRFISAAKIRTTCGINVNVPDLRIIPHLDVAQTTLRKLWGITLYDRVKDAIVADPTLAGEPELTTLLEDYAHPYLAWFTMSKAYPSVHSWADANGVFSMTGEKFQAVDSRTLQTHVQVCADNAEEYATAMVNFLKENSDAGDDYPEYATTVTQDRRTDSQLPGGFVTRRMKGQGSYFNPGRITSHEDW